MKQTEFVNGVRVFKPFPNAPDFVKFSGVITKKDITEWLKTQKDEIKFVVKESRKGGYYVEVDTFVPTKREPVVNPYEISTIGADLSDNSLPF